VPVTEKSSLASAALFIPRNVPSSCAVGSAAAGSGQDLSPRRATWATTVTIPTPVALRGKLEDLRVPCRRRGFMFRRAGDQRTFGPRGRSDRAVMTRRSAEAASRSTRRVWQRTRDSWYTPRAGPSGANAQIVGADADVVGGGLVGEVGGDESFWGGARVGVRGETLPRLPACCPEQTPMWAGFIAVAGRRHGLDGGEQSKRRSLGWCTRRSCPPDGPGQPGVLVAPRVDSKWPLPRSVGITRRRRVGRGWRPSWLGVRPRAGRAGRVIAPVMRFGPTDADVVGCADGASSRPAVRAALGIGKGVQAIVTPRPGRARAVVRACLDELAWRRCNSTEGVPELLVAGTAAVAVGRLIVWWPGRGVSA